MLQWEGGGGYFVDDETSLMFVYFFIKVWNVAFKYVTVFP